MFKNLNIFKLLFCRRLGSFSFVFNLILKYLVYFHLVKDIYGLS